ncbi:MAG: hypothetical protein ABSB32_01715 [Thermodesulfobacteriota bacterium]
MSEEASAGEEVIQSAPLRFRKGKAESEGSANISLLAILTPWKNHCLMIPRECPPGRIDRLS